MRSTTRTRLSAVAVTGAATLAFTVASVAGGATARSHHHADGGASTLLRTGLLPSTAAGPTIDGVTPGNKDWSLDRGRARVRSDGSLVVKVRGLVFTESGTTTTLGGITLPAVSASLFCDGSTTPVGTTPTAPLSPTGDASITGTLTLPATCTAPVVMVHPGANAGAYIAISGFHM